MLSSAIRKSVSPLPGDNTLDWHAIRRPTAGGVRQRGRCLVENRGLSRVVVGLHCGPALLTSVCDSSHAMALLGCAIKMISRENREFCVKDREGEKKKRGGEGGGGGRGRELQTKPYQRKSHAPGHACTLKD